MTSISQPYQVSIVHADLTPAETLKDLFYALDNLSISIDDILNRIELRIGEEQKRVDQIKSRVNVSKAKVEKVKGSQRATTVFSTAKFPGSQNLPSYPTLFSQLCMMPSPHREAEDEDHYSLPSVSNSIVGNVDLEIETTGILYRLNAVNTDMERVEFVMEKAGLGPVPPTVSSVGSLLLFNSNINPYKDYRTLDNLQSTGREKAVEEEVLKALANAPKTLVDGDALPDIQALDLMFKPMMGEMSSLALPENLPLDFIASGIQFDAGDLPSIAPSSFQGNKPNYSLPQITDGGLYSHNTPTMSTTMSKPPPPASMPGSRPGPGGGAAPSNPNSNSNSNSNPNPDRNIYLHLIIKN